MSKELTPLDALNRLYGHGDLICRNEIAYLLYQEELADYYSIIKKALKALEIIKENLIVSYDESENDKPCLMLSIKVGKDNLVVIYETFDKEKIDLLKEVLL